VKIYHPDEFSSSELCIIKLMLLHSRSRARLQMFRILGAALLVGIGLFIFKYIPQFLWGDDIQFDASQHVAITILLLYCLWFFIDQNKSWRLPFFVFATALVVFIAIQRIIVGAHNEIGVLLGLLISLGAIAFVERKKLKKKISF